MKYLTAGAILLAATTMSLPSNAVAQRKLTGDAPARAAAATTAPTLPTEADIRATFEAGDHAETLKQLTRVLGLKGRAAEAYDRYALTMLKGESHLRLKQFKSAADAFAAAAKLTDDETQAATARATARLVTEAKGGKVERRGGAARAGAEQARAADLLDPEQRDAALGIVHENLRAAAEPKVKAARRARALPEIAEALALVRVTCDFELALGGGDGRDRAARDELAGRAVELISKELTGIERDVAAIKERAETILTHRYVERRSASYDVALDAEYVPVVNGLSNADRKDLKVLTETCAKIVPTAESLADTGAVEREEAKALADRAMAARRTAERLLATKYRK